MATGCRLIRRERLEAESSQEAAWTWAAAEVGPARGGEERDACEKEPVVTDSEHESVPSCGPGSVPGI